MRRLRIAILLLSPCVTGCTIAMEEGFCESMKVIEFSASKPKPTTVAYCEPAAK